MGIHQRVGSVDADAGSRVVPVLRMRMTRSSGSSSVVPSGNSSVTDEITSSSPCQTNGSLKLRIPHLSPRRFAARRSSMPSRMDCAAAILASRSSTRTSGSSAKIDENNKSKTAKRNSKLPSSHFRSRLSSNSGVRQPNVNGSASVSGRPRLEKAAIFTYSKKRFEFGGHLRRQVGKVRVGCLLRFERHGLLDPSNLCGRRGGPVAEEAVFPVSGEGPDPEVVGRPGLQTLATVRRLVGGPGDGFVVVGGGGVGADLHLVAARPFHRVPAPLDEIPAERGNAGTRRSRRRLRRRRWRRRRSCGRRGGRRCPSVAAGRQQQAGAKEQDGHQTPSPGGGRPAWD